MEAQEKLSQDQDGLAGEVMHSLGEGRDAAHEVNESHESSSEQNSNEGVDHARALASAKKRLKAQSMNHEREMRDLHAKIADMQTRLQPQSNNPATNPYGAQPQAGSADEQIHRAVSYALQHKEMKEREAKDAQSQAHVQRQYKELHKHLENMGDKYDDFHDVVFGEDTKYTPAMRDYSMTLPKQGKGAAGEVLYHLGKNPSELERIGNLHPLDQASEMSKLSQALMTGGESKTSQSSRPLGQIKTNPVVDSRVVNEKTPIGNIRARMKSGTWK